MQDNKLIKALVLNAQLGNNSAFEQLYQMTVEQIYALVLRLTGNNTLAERLTKQTYVNAWMKLSQKDEIATFVSWLKRIAIETVIKEQNEIKKVDNTSSDKFFLKQHLETRIRNLEFNDRLVFILHDMENISFQEISKCSGLSDEEIKTRLAGTRELLIKLLEE
jgi:RNA polymerase sigma-70 factor (ECF subfamily)